MSKLKAFILPNKNGMKSWKAVFFLGKLQIKRKDFAQTEEGFKQARDWIKAMKIDFRQEHDIHADQE